MGEHQCFSCKHQTQGSIVDCKAYPDGKPLDIVSGEFDHREPHFGDNGIQFEQRVGGETQDGG